MRKEIFRICLFCFVVVALTSCRTSRLIAPERPLVGDCHGFPFSGKSKGISANEVGLPVDEYLVHSTCKELRPEKVIKISKGERGSGTQQFTTGIFLKKSGSIIPENPKTRKRTFNNRAVWGFILSLFAWMLYLFGAYFSYFMCRKALREIEESNGTQKGRGLARAGLTISIVFLVIAYASLIFSLVWAAAYFMLMLI